MFLFQIFSCLRGRNLCLQAVVVAYSNILFQFLFAGFRLPLHLDSRLFADERLLGRFGFGLGLPDKSLSISGKLVFRYFACLSYRKLIGILVSNDSIGVILLICGNVALLIFAF